MAFMLKALVTAGWLLLLVSSLVICLEHPGRVLTTTLSHDLW